VTDPGDRQAVGRCSWENKVRSRQRETARVRVRSSGISASVNQSPFQEIGEPVGFSRSPGVSEATVGRVVGRSGWLPFCRIKPIMSEPIPDLPRVRAPEFPAGLDWIHTGGRPLTLSGLRGKVVLLDFWTYG
jgi:hypothetical protein